MFLTIKSNEINIPEEIASISRTQVISQIQKIRMMKNTVHKHPDLEFFVDDNRVSFDEYVLAAECYIQDKIDKMEETTKLVWIQQGVCHNSGYYKRVKK